MKKSKTFQAPAIVTGIRPLKDGGMSVTFHTNELTLNDKIILLDFHQKFGFVLFKENEFTGEEVPKEDAPNDNLKTSSQRLRSVLYRYWEHLSSEKDFEVFYREKMEYIIGQFKTQLEAKP